MSTFRFDMGILNTALPEANTGMPLSDWEQRVNSMTRKRLRDARMVRQARPAEPRGRHLTASLWRTRLQFVSVRTLGRESACETRGRLLP